jgi:hypothetical protein
MKVAKIKFSEAQVKMLITGQTVILNLPDAQVHLTMDMTRIEMRKAADKFAGVGKKSSRFDDFDLPDFMDEPSKPGERSFRDIFADVFEKSKR